MYETWFRCIDSNCPKYNIRELASRISFLQHVGNKSTDRLREIVITYNIVTFPQVLNRRTLIDLVIDHSKEPVASEIIKKFRVVT